ncbi:hypothetical protein CHARACLAT_020799 [Characodon lateralis]|uniref:Uncharacterized protein n=1 Tax=Characodon lateralis TaxID=208331 RepID=A0ABU7EDA5_9TELE|nr:hypothetical protein [Characodon lateralis]
MPRISVFRQRENGRGHIWVFAANNSTSAFEGSHCNAHFTLRPGAFNKRRFRKMTQFYSGKTVVLEENQP